MGNLTTVFGMNTKEFVHSWCFLLLKGISTWKLFRMMWLSIIDRVMITERMEESLTLFRYKMCWTPEDTVVFDHNVRSPDQVVQLNEDDKKELEKWLKADLKIYKYFCKVFEKRVASYPPGNMALEIQRKLPIERKDRNIVLRGNLKIDMSLLKYNYQE